MMEEEVFIVVLKDFEKDEFFLSCLKLLLSLGCIFWLVFIVVVIVFGLFF